MDKTVVVQVRTLVRDPVYKRVVKRSRRFRAHDADRQAHLGDLVRIMETRPLSATKRWRLVAVLERAR
jgi:small subunit ribosomal protein S17